MKIFFVKIEIAQSKLRYEGQYFNIQRINLVSDVFKRGRGGKGEGVHFVVIAKYILVPRQSDVT